MHNIYGRMYFFLGGGVSVLTSSKGQKQNQSQGWRGPTVRIKSPTLAGQLCIEVAYLGTIITLWERKNTSPQIAGST